MAGIRNAGMRPRSSKHLRGTSSKKRHKNSSEAQAKYHKKISERRAKKKKK